MKCPLVEMVVYASVSSLYFRLGSSDNLTSLSPKCTYALSFCGFTSEDPCGDGFFESVLCFTGGDIL